MRYPLLLPLLFVGMCSLSSCFLGEFFKDPEIAKYPDTLVMATKANMAQVQFIQNDSIYNIVRYWTDDNGKWLYKLMEEPYKRGRLHGRKVIWNEWGDTLHLSFWDEGIQRDSMLEFYEHKPSQLRQLVYYHPNGNKDYEIYYHPNGKARTDTILYYKGLRNGEVRFFDSIPNNFNPTETYFYKDDKLIDVKIHNKMYDAVAMNALKISLIMERLSDSMTLADKLRLDGVAEEANKTYIQKDKSTNKDYKGNVSTDVDADVW